MYSTTWKKQIWSIPATRERTDDKYQGGNPFSGMHGTMEDDRGILSFSFLAVNVYSGYCLTFGGVVCKKDFRVGLVLGLQI